MFASAFSLIGTVLLGLVLGVVGSDIVETQISLQENMQRRAKRAVEKAFRVGEEKAHTTLTVEDSVRAADDDTSCDSDSLSNVNPRSLRHEEGGYELLAKLASHWPAIFSIGLGGLVVSFNEKWDWHQISYYTIVTATTVGLGDLTPSHPVSKLFAIVYIPLSVAIAAFILGNVASLIIDRRRNRTLQKLWSAELTIHDFAALDEDSDGNVTELEYMRFMLMAMEKVDRALFDDLKSQFERLDKTGNGKISKKDLELAELEKLKKVERKLELARYKNSLSKKSRKRRGFRAMFTKVRGARDLSMKAHITGV